MGCRQSSRSRSWMGELERATEQPLLMIVWWAQLGSMQRLPRVLRRRQPWGQELMDDMPTVTPALQGHPGLLTTSILLVQGFCEERRLRLRRAVKRQAPVADGRRRETAALREAPVEHQKTAAPSPGGWGPGQRTIHQARSMQAARQGGQRYRRPAVISNQKRGAFIAPQRNLAPPKLLDAGVAMRFSRQSRRPPP